MNSTITLTFIAILALLAITLKITGKKKAGAISAGLVFAGLGAHQLTQGDTILAITALTFGAFLAAEPWLYSLKK